jgi:plastocyanin
MRTPLIAAALTAALPLAPADAAPVPFYVATVNSVYAPGDLTIPQGSSVTLVNLENVAHDLVAVDEGPTGLPEFQARIVAGPGDTAQVVGVENVGLGYHQFYCSLHEGMRGTFNVI